MSGIETHPLAGYTCACRPEQLEGFGVAAELDAYLVKDSICLGFEGIDLRLAERLIRRQLVADRRSRLSGRGFSSAGPFPSTSSAS